jgi:hypothetical protein
MQISPARLLDITEIFAVYRAAVAYAPPRIVITDLQLPNFSYADRQSA